MNKLFKGAAALLSAAAMSAALSVGASALGDLPQFNDEAGMTDSSQQQELCGKLERISEEYQCDVAAVIVDSFGGKSSMDFADDYFDYNGFGYGTDRDGVVLAISVSEREYWISTRGYGITAFTDAGIDRIGSDITEYLGNDDYYGGVDTFADDCEDFIIRAKNGDPFDIDDASEPMPLGAKIAIAVVGGMVIAIISMIGMISELTTVKPASGAEQYVKPGSFNVTRSRDIFLYTTVSKTAKPQDTGGSSTHTSSSGASHGGGGGSF